MLGQGKQQYGAMISDGEISGFVGFDMFFFFFTGVLVLLCMGFLVFDFFFFLCNFFFSDLKISQ